MATGTPIDVLANLRTLKYNHSLAVTAGDILLHNGHVLIAVNATLANEDNVWIYRGKIGFPKTSALVISVGDVCYWDDTAKEVNKTASGNTRVGICVEDSSASDEAVIVNLSEN